VYDIDIGRWRRFDDLYYKYWVSDLGGFKAGNRAFFVGGFTEDYRALARVFSIDPTASWQEGTLQILRHRNLIHRRGDVGVAVDVEERFAYVSGGSTDENSFCTPLNSVERYNLTTREWTEMAPLQQGRAGKAVIEIENQLVALGGAQQIGKICKQNASNPSDMQIPVYEIEAYNDIIGRWDIIDNLSEYRSRSTSVVYNDKVYSFGGQTRYFSQCMCHPTVDDVRIYNEGSPEDEYAGSDMINEWQPNFGEKEAPEEDPLVVNSEYQYDSLRANSGSTGLSTTRSALATASIFMFTVAFL
jgi:hypothetical protein